MAVRHLIIIYWKFKMAIRMAGNDSGRKAWGTMALIFILLAFSAQPIFGKLSIKAHLDSTQAMMGRMLMLQLKTTQTKGQPADLPFLSRANDDGIVRLLGDTVEVRTAVSIDTVDIGSGVREITYNFPMQIFNPGNYTIPPFALAAGGDTVYSNPVVIKVLAPNVTENDTIRPDAGVVGPYYDSKFQKFTDKIPDFLYYYWWVIIIVVLAIAAFIYAIYMYRKKGRLLPVKEKPAPDPYKLALSSLQKLSEDKLWEKGQEREYFTRLTDILREYLRGRFNINALEMTTSQIVNSVKDNPEASKNKKYVEDILKIADFVKFAKMRPLPDDNIQAFTDALEFVKATKPEPKPAPEAVDAKPKTAAVVK